MFLYEAYCYPVLTPVLSISQAPVKTQEQGRFYSNLKYLKSVTGTFSSSSRPTPTSCGVSKTHCRPAAEWEDKFTQAICELKASFKL